MKTPASGYRRPPQARAWGSVGATVALAGVALGLAILQQAPGSIRSHPSRLSAFDVRRSTIPKPVADAPKPRAAKPIPLARRKQVPESRPQPIRPPGIVATSTLAPGQPKMLAPALRVESRPTGSGEVVPERPAGQPGADRAAYAALLWQQIAARRPSGLRLPGTTILLFMLDRNGDLADVSVQRTSGSALLDRIAVRTVRRAAPFPAPPAGIGDLTFSVAFRFDAPAGAPEG